MQGKRRLAPCLPMHSSPDPLDPWLDRWGRPPTSPALSAEVHRRLASLAPTRSRPDSLFLRPAFAAVFIAACVLLGLFLAEVRLSRLHRERDRELMQSYRRLIDPLLSAHPPASADSGGRS